VYLDIKELKKSLDLIMKVMKNGEIPKEHLWLDFLSLVWNYMSLLMIYYRLMKMMNGFLLKVKILLNIGLAYLRRPMQNYMVDITK
jgi:hypothetical protein